MKPVKNKKNFNFKKKFKVGGVKIKNAKKKTIDGINFKSQLEAYCYTALHKEGITNFEYEGHKFLLQDKFEFPLISWELQSKKQGGKIIQTFELNTPKIRSITYTPDFVSINEHTKEGWIIETKGFRTTDFKIKWKMFKKLLVDYGFKVDLYVPNTQLAVNKVINLIKNKNV